jgi:hypothetical protein
VTAILCAIALADGYESLGEVKLAAKKRVGLDAFTNRVHLQVGCEVQQQLVSPKAWCPK